MLSSKLMPLKPFRWEDIIVNLFLHTHKLLIMSNGTVKFFNVSKGFGFIAPDDGTKDVFVHQSGLVDKITEGDKVSYDVEQGQKGLSAVKVKKAG